MLFQQLIKLRIRATLARTAEVLGSAILYDSMQGRLGQTTRLLLKMVNLSLNRRPIIKFSKNSLRKTLTQEIKQLKQFIIMGVEAKLVRRTNKYTRRWAYLRLCPIKVFTITRNIFRIMSPHKSQWSEVPLAHTLKTVTFHKQTLLFNRVILAVRWQNQMPGYY